MRSARLLPQMGLACLTSLLAAPLAAQLPRGHEFGINRNRAGAQSSADVAVAADGGFAVAWQDGAIGAGIPRNVKVRVFGADGRARTGEIRAGRAEAGRQELPRIAMAPDGRFVVVWRAMSDPRGPSQVFGRLFDAGGHPLARRFRLGPEGDRNQTEADVAMAADGSFVAVWSEEDGGSIDGFDTYDVRGRRFLADGTPAGPDFPLGEETFEDQDTPRVAIDPAGGFVVAFQSYRGEGSFYDVFVRRFAADGSPLGDEVQANSGPSEAANQVDPAIAVGPDGRFLVAWTDFGLEPEETTGAENAGTAWGVAARLFGADGVTLRSDFKVNVFSRDLQAGPAVGATPDGGFLIAWTSGGDQDGDGEGIFARAFAADGRRRGREFRINLVRAGDQSGPAVALAPDGRGAAVWTSQDGDATGIAGRLLGQPTR